MSRMAPVGAGLGRIAILQNLRRVREIMRMPRNLQNRYYSEVSRVWRGERNRINRRYANTPNSHEKAAELALVTELESMTMSPASYVSAVRAGKALSHNPRIAAYQLEFRADLAYYWNRTVPLVKSAGQVTLVDFAIERGDRILDPDFFQDWVHDLFEQYEQWPDSQVRTDPLSVDAPNWSTHMPDPFLEYLDGGSPIMGQDAQSKLTNEQRLLDQLYSGKIDQPIQPKGGRQTDEEAAAEDETGITVAPGENPGLSLSSAETQALVDQQLEDYFNSYRAVHQAQMDVFTQYIAGDLSAPQAINALWELGADWDWATGIITQMRSKLDHGQANITPDIAALIDQALRGSGNGTQQSSEPSSSVSSETAKKSGSEEGGMSASILSSLESYFAALSELILGPGELSPPPSEVANVPTGWSGGGGGAGGFFDLFTEACRGKPGQIVVINGVPRRCPDLR